METGARYRVLRMAAVAASLVRSSLALAAPGPVILSETVRDVALGPDPVTIALAPHGDFATALEAARRGTSVVVLALQNIRGKSTQPLRINVFLDKPDANRATPPADSHFVGFVYLIPTRSEVRGGRAFDLSGLKSFDPKSLRVTLVPIAGTDAAPRDASIVVGQVDVRRDD